MMVRARQQVVTVRLCWSVSLQAANYAIQTLASLEKLDYAWRIQIDSWVGTFNDV